MTRDVAVGAAQLGPIAARPHPQGGRRAAARPAAPGPTRPAASSSCSPSWPSPPSSPGGSSTTCARPTTGTSGPCPVRTRSRCSTRRPDSAIGFCLGYAELTPDGHRYNTQVLVERDGRIVARYRKVHIPGHEHDEPDRPFQHARAPLLRAGPGRLRRVAGVRRPRRDDDLQRPALARDLPGDGAPGRRADPLRLQHAHPLRARPEPGHPPGLPQRARACSPARTRTARGWSAWPRAASRRASTRWPSRASWPRAGRSSPRR